jgi:outer membrane protein
MKWRIVVLALQGVLTGALCCSTAFAADLMEVWQAAKGHDPEYLAARSEQSAGDARRRQGDSLSSPSVNFVAGAGVVNQSSAISGAQFSTPSFGTFNNANFNTSINSGFMTKYAVQASQPLYDRELTAQKNQLKLSGDVADMGMVASDRTLILRVTEIYFETLKAKSVIELLGEQQNAVSNTYTEISKRQHLGDASKIDMQETAEQVEAIKARILSAQLAAKNNSLMLMELTGQDFKINSLNAGFNAAEVPIGNMNDLRAKAKLQNPQLQMLALRKQVSSAEIEKYSARSSPKINLIAQVERDQVNGSGDYGSASNTTSNNMIGIQLSVPLMDGYRSAKNDEAIHLAEKANLEYERASLDIEKQINSVWFSLTTGKDRINSLTRMVALSKERLDTTEKSHRQGSRSTLELLGAENDLVSAKLALLEEQINFIVNRIRLSSIVGDVSEQDLIFANRFLVKN